MDNKTEKLNKFFEETKTLTFWKRVFGWSRFRELSYEAYQEFKALLSQVELQARKIESTERDISIQANNVEHLGDTIQQHNLELSAIKERLANQERENARLTEENIIFKQTDESRKRAYEERAATLNAIEMRIQDDRQRESSERQQAEIDRLERQKETWAKHEIKVQEAIKTICQKHTIEYVDKVPFKGSPDNTIKLCNEYIIFDAKSPASDDLGNFLAYIKSQTESVKKYIKEENVKKEIYLVIPSNTVEVIENTAFKMGDYNVYVVTLDVLEPLILALKKLEEYEFVNQLSPDERDNICKVIGRFAHMTKRRIQIDQFFDRQFLEILLKCEADLPSDILEKAVEFEKAEKLNPPQEKRSKQISNKTLQMDSQQIRKEAEAKDIAFPSTMQRDITNLPLYTDDKPEVVK